MNAQSANPLILLNLKCFIIHIMLTSAKSGRAWAGGRGWPDYAMGVASIPGAGGQNPRENVDSRPRLSLSLSRIFLPRKSCSPTGLVLGCDFADFLIYKGFARKTGIYAAIGYIRFRLIWR